VHNKLPPTRELDLLGRNRFRQSQTAATAGASSSSHSSFCEEVFSICVVAGIVDPARRDHRSRLQPNEVDRTNILAPGVCSDLCRSHLLPAFTVFLWRPRMLSGHNQRVAGGTPATTTIGPIGKLYPVTAAQLLPILTGFLAPIHFSKLAKNWIEK